MPGQALSIIVPTYHEAANIPILVDRIFATLDRAGLDGEVILVDDDSGDGTDAAVAKLARSRAVRLIVRTNDRGLSTAVLRGFAEARNDVLVCMDADLSHPPESIPDVAGPVLRGEAEFVIGSRYAAGGKTLDDWGLLRRINSRGATLLARPLTRLADPMAGFFCLTRDVLRRAEAAGLDPIGYKIALEILVKARCSRATETPIEFSDRLHGKSKLTVGEQWNYLRHLARLYRFRWPMLSRVACIAAIGVALSLGAWIVTASAARR